MDNNDYCEKKLKPILDPLFLNLVTSRPRDILNYSIDWLMKNGEYTANGLSLDERHELINLRKELKKYKDIEADQKQLNSLTTHEDYPESEEEEEPESEEEHGEVEQKVNVRMPRIAVSAEVYGEFNKKKAYEPVVHDKTDEQITAIKVRLIQSFLFNSLEGNELKIVIDAMEQHRLKAGDEVIKQGEHGDCLYLVESGELECSKNFSSGETKVLKTYSDGEAFGELALLYNAPRAATVKAITDVVLWKLDRVTFNEIVKDAAM